MTREEFKAMLVRMVRARKITESEASALLRRFDRGEIEDDALPLPLSEAISKATADDIKSAVTLLGVALIAGSLARRERERESLQDRFQEKARGLARSLVEDNRTAKFEASMAEAIRTHILQQSMLGRGGPPDLRELNPLILEQLAFNSRFADDITIRLLLERELSEKAIAARAETYSGAGRAEWFRSAEFVEGDDDTVIDYVAVDDNGTCEPCLISEGVYLPADGPMPGEVCEGKGFCRCTRVPRSDPEEAKRLRDAA